ncbi:MAG: aspartate 1-decarboxylase [Nanoarchaeota archaeon]
MMRTMLRSKIHKATVTQADLDYIGSITIDEDLLTRADIWEGEQVMVVDNTNGARLFTYVIKGERGSGIICMNGAAAHLVKVGDEIIVMAFGIAEKPIEPINILVDKKNKFLRDL